MPIARIFISSVQKELAAERRALKDFVHNDALLRQHFEVFLFEDLPASDQRTDAVYLHEVDRCDLYVGLFGRDYGHTDANGVSPTEQEFDRATAQGRERLIYVVGTTDEGRDPRMVQLLRKAGEQLIRKRVGSAPELTTALYASLIDHLQRTGIIRHLPYDASACHSATLDDLDPEKVERFLRSARQERHFVLGPGTPVRDVLTHLNLLDGDRPSHAAVLLFGKAPQRHIGLMSSEVKCMHFHGTTVGKPIPDYKIFKGTVFELVDHALDFVMSKLPSRVGTRAESNAAPVTYEIPREVVSEAIVNAVAHRDYASGASVQVMLFADRLEIWNPGAFPPELTMAALRRAHPSIPRNPLIAEPLFLAHYIEKAGTGILDMMKRCEQAGLPALEFKPTAGHVVLVLGRLALDPTIQAAIQVKALKGSLLDELAAALGPATIQVTIQVAIQVAGMLAAAGRAPQKSAVLQRAMGLQSLDYFRRTFRIPLVQAQWLAMTDPDRPNNPNQLYKLTPQGQAWLDRFNTLPTA